MKLRFSISAILDFESRSIISRFIGLFMTITFSLFFIHGRDFNNSSFIKSVWQITKSTPGYPILYASVYIFNLNPLIRWKIEFDSRTIIIEFLKNPILFKNARRALIKVW